MGLVQLVYLVQLPPPADSLDLLALDGLMRAVALVWAAAPRCDADHARFHGDQMIIVQQAGGNGFTSVPAMIVYVAARALHISPDLLLDKKDGENCVARLARG
jgi:hypothetical protein